MIMFEQGEFVDRDTFGTWLNSKSLTRYAVEVGTHRGEFASVFLNRWAGQKLWCVDPWKAGYDDCDPASWGDRDLDYRHAVAALAQFRRRVEIVKQSSVEAAETFPAGHLDFVYVDGCHQYADTLQDLTTWWLKLRPGGVLAGHDIICPGEKAGGWGQTVQPAVMDFASAHDRSINLVVELSGAPWSYYFVK